MDEWITPPTWTTNQIVQARDLRVLYEGIDFLAFPGYVQEVGSTGVTISMPQNAAFVDLHASRFREFFDWAGGDLLFIFDSSLVANAAGITWTMDLELGGISVSGGAGIMVHTTIDGKDILVNVPKMFTAAYLTSLGIVPGNMEAVVKVKRPGAGSMTLSHGLDSGIVLIEV